MTAKKKNYSRGGGVLLKKHGPDYFRELAEKRANKQRKAMALWNKTHPKKKSSSTRIAM